MSSLGKYMFSCSIFREEFSKHLSNSLLIAALQERCHLSDFELASVKVALKDASTRSSRTDDIKQLLLAGSIVFGLLDGVKEATAHQPCG